MSNDDKNHFPMQFIELNA